MFIVAMEWTYYHMRVTIIGLMKAGKNAKQIQTLLKLLTKVSEHFVYRVLALGDIVNQPRSGLLRTAHTKNVVETVHACINQNPERLQETIAKVMNVAPRMLSHIKRRFRFTCI